MSLVRVAGAPSSGARATAERYRYSWPPLPPIRELIPSRDWAACDDDNPVSLVARMRPLRPLRGLVAIGQTKPNKRARRGALGILSGAGERILSSRSSGNAKRAQLNRIQARSSLAQPARPTCWRANEGAAKTPIVASKRNRVQLIDDPPLRIIYWPPLEPTYKPLYLRSVYLGLKLARPT